MFANSVAENVLGTSESVSDPPCMRPPFTRPPRPSSRHRAVDGPDHTAELEELAGTLYRGSLCLSRVRPSHSFALTGVCALPEQ